MQSCRKQRALATVLALGAANLSGCATSVRTPAPSSPLPQGVFSTTDDCDIRTTSPSGAQTTQTITNTITFEINERGVPVILGEEIAVGRTVQLEGVQLTYTRIAATSDGLVIHGTITGTVNDVSFTGAAIATLSATSTGSIEYDFTQNWTDSAGFVYNMGCELVLVP